MELVAIWRVLVRRWWLILLPVAVVAILVLPALVRSGIRGEGGFSVTLRYTAHQQLDAFPNRQGDYQDVWLASELLVNALTDWIRTSRFADEVTMLLGDDAPAWSLVATDNQRSVGVIVLASADADGLMQVAEAVMQVLSTRTQAYFPQLGDDNATVVFLDMPNIVPSPPPLTDRFSPFLRLGLALLVGIGLAFLVEYLSPVVYYADELENMGMRVITHIPKR